MTKDQKSSKHQDKSEKSSMWKNKRQKGKKGGDERKNQQLRNEEEMDDFPDIVLSKTFDEDEQSFDGSSSF